MTVCFGVDAGHDGGTTVAPSFYANCTVGGALALRTCRDFDFVGGYAKTGFVPNPQFPLPCYDPASGEVRSSGGTVGTLYVNGAETPVNIPPFFVGNPNGAC